ncbi:unnamed protein product [Meganyctiphanes norvegica]|uniref:Uncharacterized protein n=1 Tax=Meganyctiphanes norvegica TaxID=48144 RepID=A0AAV2SJY2_MEGNR
MLDGCIYHILQSLIPPADNEWHNFRQLAFLSACKLIERDVPQMINKIPPRLLESLIQAFIYKHFYTPGKKENLPHSLVQLIIHWPYEELDLFKLMPQLPPHEKKFADSKYGGKDGPLDDTREELERFYEHVVKCVSQIITFRKKPLCTSSPPKKINVSGLLGGASLFNPRTLLDNIRDSYFASDTENKIEFNCDIWLNGNDEESTERVKDIRKTCENGGLNVVFHKAALWGGIPDGALEVLEENEIEYLELRGCYVNDTVASNLIKYLPHLKGLSFTCFTLVNTLHFLNDMYNLQQLDLTSLDLRDGTIAPLCFTSHGLQYLNLADCKMNSGDIDLFIDSLHPASLRQLDLTLIDFSAMTASFSESLTWNPLIRLCENLPMIEVLVLRVCNLHCLMEELMIPLIKSLIAMPHLTLLDLGENYFSPRILSKYFVKLRENQCLRYLKLSVDEEEFYDIYENTIAKEDITNFMNKTITELNENRESPLHVYFSQRKSAHVHLFIHDEDVEVIPDVDVIPVILDDSQNINAENNTSDHSDLSIDTEDYVGDIGHENYIIEEDDE